MIKVGINGFGRIGRFVFRAAMWLAALSPAGLFKNLYLVGTKSSLNSTR